MACGKPVIISDIDELAELNQDNNLLAIAAGNHNALTEKIIYLHQNPEIRQSIGANARKYAVDNFDINKTALEHEKLYSELI